MSVQHLNGVIMYICIFMIEILIGVCIPFILLLDCAVIAPVDSPALLVAAATIVAAAVAVAVVASADSSSFHARADESSCGAGRC